MSDGSGCWPTTISQRDGPGLSTNGHVGPSTWEAFPTPATLAFCVPRVAQACRVSHQSTACGWGLPGHPHGQSPPRSLQRGEQSLDLRPRREHGLPRTDTAHWQQLLNQTEQRGWMPLAAASLGAGVGMMSHPHWGVSGPRTKEPTHAPTTPSNRKAATTKKALLTAQGVGATQKSFHFKGIHMTCEHKKSSVLFSCPLQELFLNLLQ